ncbi:MAG: glutamate--cysteine ligase [Mycobacteriaceae bacterium]|nr:glutamate--cysteine ligase [Mycobacteriaceae bacterium]
MTRQGVPTIGVEEEYLLIDPASRAPEPASARVIARAAGHLGDLVSGEFTRCQIEVKTPPCADPGRLREELLRLRAGVAAAATAEGLRICASGTPAVAQREPPPIGDHPRYRAGARQYRAMLDDFAVCACHVHIDLPDREVAVLVGNHVRVWLPLLVALSANSPFHQGQDTGYADWRAVIRSRFACLGPPPYAESLRQHNEIAAAIAESGAMLDPDTPFWDIRPNPRLPTLEIRAMDVIAHVDDAVALAVLIRALVVTATAKVLAGDPGPRPCSELLRAAYWRSARDGWSGSGVDALTGRILPAAVQAGRLVDFVRPALDQHGDTDLVMAFLRRLAMRGGGAEGQRASAARHGTLSAVVDDLVELTFAQCRSARR